MSLTATNRKREKKQRQQNGMEWNQYNQTEEKYIYEQLVNKKINKSEKNEKKKAHSHRQRKRRHHSQRNADNSTSSCYVSCIGCFVLMHGF